MSSDYFDISVNIKYNDDALIKVAGLPTSMCTMDYIPTSLRNFVHLYFLDPLQRPDLIQLVV